MYVRLSVCLSVSIQDKDQNLRHPYLTHLPTYLHTTTGRDDRYGGGRGGDRYGDRGGFQNNRGRGGGPGKRTDFQLLITGLPSSAR